MSINTFIKSPTAFLDYSIDWSDWLQETETITASTWASDSVDLTLSLPANSGTKTTIWIDGGVDGNGYTVSNTITTSEDRIDTRTITISCEVR